MAEGSVYSRIGRRITSERAFRELSHDAQLLWFLLRCGRHVTSVPGLWAVQRPALVEDWRFTRRSFDKAFAELTAAGYVEADWTAGVVWMPSVIDDDDPANPKVVEGWVKRLELIPECDLKDRAIAALDAWLQANKTAPRRDRKTGEVKEGWFTGWRLTGDGLVDGVGDGPPNGSGNGSPNGMRNPDPDPDPEPNTKSGSGAGAGPGTVPQKPKPFSPTADLQKELQRIHGLETVHMIAIALEYRDFWTIGGGKGKGDDRTPEQWITHYREHVRDVVHSPGRLDKIVAQYSSPAAARHTHFIDEHGRLQEIPR